MSIARRLQLTAVAVVAVVILVILVFDEQVAWRDLLLPSLLALGVAVILATLVARTLTRSMDDLQSVTRSLAEGNLMSRPLLSGPGEIGSLSTAIHRLAEQLGQRMSALQSEDALLTALIESLNEGVVAIDANRQAIRINRVGRELMHINDRTPFSIDQLPRIPAVRDAVHAALAGQIIEPSEIVVGDRTLSLTARPLRDGGAVIALFDLTPVRRLELVRRDFVANASHELKTPLTVIGGFAETLATDDPPDSSRKSFAHAIQTHTRRMQRIVDDLLDLSRLESGKWTPDVMTVNVAPVANEVFDSLRSTAEAKRISLNIALAENAKSVRTDGTALRQVLANLIENAVRHTESGSVVVSSDSDSNGVWLRVRDTGSGIPPEHLPRIFERFYRVDPGRTRDAGGTGLGLAIVKHLVEAHGGKVKAESEVGAGTTISAFFPSSYS